MCSTVELIDKNSAKCCPCEISFNWVPPSENAQTWKRPLGSASHQWQTCAGPCVSFSPCHCEPLSFALCKLPPAPPARPRLLWPAGGVGPFASVALHCGAACQLHLAVTSVGRRLWGWSPGLPQQSLRSPQQSLLGSQHAPDPRPPCSSHSCPGRRSPKSCSRGPAPPGTSLGPHSVLPAPPAPAQPCCLRSGVSLSRDPREAVSPTQPSRLPGATPC